MAAAILDVDGTLVDSNYQHVIAWYRAFRDHDVTPPMWRIHRPIGMGGDQLVAAVAGQALERESGDSIRAAEKRLYGELIDEVSVFEGARELLDELKARHYEEILEHEEEVWDVVQGKASASPRPIKCRISQINREPKDMRRRPLDNGRI